MKGSIHPTHPGKEIRENEGHEAFNKIMQQKIYISSIIGFYMTLSIAPCAIQ